jgi:hypothetical protein
MLLRNVFEKLVHVISNSLMWTVIADFLDLPVFIGVTTAENVSG